MQQENDKRVTPQERSLADVVSQGKVRKARVFMGVQCSIVFLDNQGREIKDQDKILERREEFYTELYHRDQTVTVRTCPREVPSVKHGKYKPR